MAVTTETATLLRKEVDYINGLTEGLEPIVLDTYGPFPVFKIGLYSVIGSHSHRANLNLLAGIRLARQAALDQVHVKGGSLGGVQ